MARKVKCQICKTELSSDIAYKVTVSKRNLYYCSEQEYMNYEHEKDLRQDLLKYIAKEILNYENFQLLPKILLKKISDLHKHYTYEVIFETFRLKENDLKYWMGLENKFNNEFQKISYMMAIISNNINDTFKLHKAKEKLVEKENKSKVENIDTDIINTKTKRKRKITDISEFIK